MYNVMALFSIQFFHQPLSNSLFSNLSPVPSALKPKSIFSRKKYMQKVEGIPFHHHITTYAVHHFFVCFPQPLFGSADSFMSSDADVDGDPFNFTMHNLEKLCGLWE